jgi:RNA polymerase sigma-70 factor (ECF subfamily)
MAGRELANKPRLATQEETDERRLVQAAQRDRARFAEIYDRYFNVVYSYAARRLRDRSRTEDLTSEVFHKALKNLPRFKWTGAPFGAWLLRIAANMIADQAKRNAREADPPADMNQPGQASSGLPNSNAKQSQQSELENAERRARLYTLIDELPADQQTVIVMRFAAEKSIREIANELDRSEGAVKQLQFRALQNLRQRWITQ